MARTVDERDVAHQPELAAAVGAQTWERVVLKAKSVDFTININRMHEKKEEKPAGLRPGKKFPSVVGKHFLEGVIESTC